MSLLVRRNGSPERSETRRTSSSSSTTYTLTSSTTSEVGPEIKSVRIGDASEGGSASMVIGGSTSMQISSGSGSGGLEVGSGQVSIGGGESSTSIRVVSGSSENGSMSVNGGGTRVIRIDGGSLEQSLGSIGGDGATTTRVGPGSVEQGSLTYGDGVSTAFRVDSGSIERRGSGSSESDADRRGSGRLMSVDMNSLTLGSISAEEERRLMQDLNARFAKYIDKIRRVEDPETLIRNEVITRVEKIEEDYENRSRQARDRIKDLEIEVHHLRTTEDDLTNQLRDKDKKIDNLEDDLRDAKDTLKEKEILINDLSVKNIEKDNFAKADVEREGIVKQVETVVQHVAAVTNFAAPPGLGLGLVPGSDEAAQASRDQPDQAPRYGTPLYSRLMALRVETEKLCLKTHQIFTANLGTLQLWVENQASHTLADLQKKNVELNARVGELQMQLTVANETSSAARNVYEAELAKLRKEMSLHLIEYNALYRAKLTLEAEIATYRKLLEEEEERLAISFRIEGGENDSGVANGGFGIRYGGSISEQGESRMEVHMSGSGSGFGGSGEGHQESGMKVHVSGTGLGGSGAEYHESGSGHFEIRSGQMESAGEHQNVVVTAEVLQDDVRKASGGSGMNVLEVIESGFDVLSAQAEKGLDDIKLAAHGDDSDHSDRSDHSD